MTSHFNPIVLGKLGSTYGIRGWLRVFSFTEEIESIFAYQPWYINQAGKWTLIELEDWKYHNQELIVKLKNFNDRELVSQLVNCHIAVDISQLPPLPVGDYYWNDLLGCQVVTLDGYDLGIVKDVMETGSNDVLVVRANLNDAFSSKERLLPFLEGQVIKKIDRQLKKIVVDWDPDF